MLTGMRVAVKTERCGGFTLVEVIVASFLMVIGFMALSGLLLGMMRGADLSRRTMTASGLAQSKIEELMQAGFADAAGGSETVDSYYTVSWTSTVSSVSTIKDVSVAASWVDHAGVGHSVQLNTMLCEERSGAGSISFTNMPVFKP